MGWVLCDRTEPGEECTSLETPDSGATDRAGPGSTVVSRADRCVREREGSGGDPLSKSSVTPLRALQKPKPLSDSPITRRLPPRSYLLWENRVRWYWQIENYLKRARETLNRIVCTVWVSCCTVQVCVDWQSHVTPPLPNCGILHVTRVNSHQEIYWLMVPPSASPLTWRSWGLSDALHHPPRSVLSPPPAPPLRPLWVSLFFSYISLTLSQFPSLFLPPRFFSDPFQWTNESLSFVLFLYIYVVLKAAGLGSYDVWLQRLFLSALIWQSCCRL